MTQPIEDYALIGDCKTAALVGRDGSIDWLCWPRFDSPACFAALLGTPENGRWQIAPKTPARAVRRRYRPGTCILETEFQTENGIAALIDFMPPGGGADLVRIVEGRTGRVDFHTELVIRFNYGASVPWVTRLDEQTHDAIAGPERLVLRTPVALRGEDLRTVGDFVVAAEDSVSFRSGGADLVRIVEGRTGRVDFHTELVIRFNYGASVPWVTRLDEQTHDAIAGPERLVLRTPVALRGEDLRTVGDFVVAAEDSVSF